MEQIWKKYFSTFFDAYSIHRTEKRTYGFTLIELLIVIGVMAVLAGTIVIILNPLTQRQKANDAKRKADLEQVQRALEQYYNDTNAYPANTGTYTISGSGGWGSSWSTYMITLPKDPDPTKKYVYVSNGQSYQLYTSLDRGANDPQTCNSGGQCTNAPGGNACGGVCNYGVTSTNTTP